MTDRGGALVAAAATMALVAASCQTALNSTEREEQFQELFPMEMNTHISLTQEEAFGEARIGWSFSLLLQNETHEPIWIAWDRNPRIFLYSSDSEGWVEIADRGVRMHEGETLAAIGEGLSAIILGVAPDLEARETPIEVRVVVVGRIISEGTPVDEEVGAYVDVVVHP